MEMLDHSFTLIQAEPAHTTEPTLAELRALRARWLADAEALGHLEACMQVARWLGEPFSIPRWELWTGYRWTAGDVVIELYEGQGRYLPGRKAYERITTLTVKRGSYQVVYHRTSDAAGAHPDSFFVPGQWLDAVLTGQAEAHQVAQAAGHASQQHERARLLAQLLIGIII